VSVALEFLWLPLLACLVLTAIHVYLGLHVLARGVIFVDLALAQVAALGITAGLLAGHPIQSDAAYWYALAFTVGGALLLALTRPHRAPVPQEAIIGIVYAVSAALTVLVVDRVPQGSEHIKQLLVGSILTVTPAEVGGLAALYGAIGLGHWLIRRPLLEISLDPGTARERRAVRAWDVAFYVSFGVVVTSSVRLAGVLLVFAYLVVPATAAALLVRSVAARLAVGWAAGSLVSVAGLAASYAADLPTGATVVAAFGALLAGVAVARAAAGLARGVRARGPAALGGVAVTLAGAVALAGLLLAAFPRMDHHWLDWVERALPLVQLAFLTPGERAVWRESQDGVRRGAAEIARLRALQQEVRWGTRQMSAEMEERLRQFLASRGEIAAGDRMVLRTLRARARERQRFWVGLPLLVAGAAGGLAAGRAAVPSWKQRTRDEEDRS
jgi:zinc/manganese transport system permease protein